MQHLGSPDFWKQLRESQNQQNQALRESASLNLALPSTLQIIYSGSKSQSPARDALQLARALQLAQIPFNFNNGLKLLQTLQPATDSALLDPYIERQWPIAAVSQSTRDRLTNEETALQLVHLASSLKFFLDIKREQASAEQVLLPAQHATTTNSGNASGHKLPAAAESGGRHYWLWNLPLYLSNFTGNGSFNLAYFSERQILVWVLLAIGIFAFSSFRAHSQLHQLRAIHQLPIGRILQTIATIFILIAAYVLFANEALLLVLQLISMTGFSSLNDLDKPGSLKLAAAIIIEIHFALLFLYSAALGLNLEKRFEVRLLPYIGQSLAFINLLLIISKDFSLAIAGLYLFFLQSLYAFIPSHSSRRRPLWLLQDLWHYGIIFLLFLPYVLLMLTLPLSPESLLLLLGSRNVYLYILTLLIFMPGLLWHFTQIQFCRWHYPRNYRNFLLRRMGWYLGTILLATLFLLVGPADESDTNSAKGSSIASKASNQPSLRLKEHFILPEYLHHSPTPEQATGSKIITLERLSPSSRELSQLSLNFASPISSLALRQNRGGQQIELQEPALFRTRNSPQADHVFSGQNLHKRLWQRDLQSFELTALQQLGDRLFRHDGNRIRENNSSILKLQSQIPLDHIAAQLRSRQLKLLSANVPFTIPHNIPNIPPERTDSDTAKLQASHLMLGAYPPADLSIELLLHRKSEPLQLYYIITLQIPANFNSKLDSRSQTDSQEDEPLKLLLPLLSHLKQNTAKGQAPDKLKPAVDYQHIVEIQGLQINLEY